jgi:hypothetical protein
MPLAIASRAHNDRTLPAIVMRELDPRIQASPENRGAAASGLPGLRLAMTTNKP